MTEGEEDFAGDAAEDGRLRMRRVGWIAAGGGETTEVVLDEIISSGIGVFRFLYIQSSRRVK